MRTTRNMNFSELHIPNSPTRRENQVMANIKPTLKRKLYAALIQLVGLMLIAESLKYTKADIFNGAGLAAILLWTFGTLVYISIPLIAGAIKEIKEKKAGIIRALIVILTAAYIFSMQQFILAKNIDTIIEFSALLFVVVAGQCVFDASKDEAATLLAAQKKQLDNVLNSLGEVIWSIDANSLDILYINEACLQVFGYRPDEMLRDKGTFFNSILDDDLDKFDKCMMEVLASGYTRCAFRVYHKSGAIRYLRGEARFTRNDNGSGVISGFTMDITNETLAEMEKQKKSAELEDVLKSINDGFFAIDKDFQLTFVNKKVQEIYRKSANALIGKSFWEIAPNAIQKTFFNHCVLAMGSNTNVSFEEYSPHLNKWLQYKIYPRPQGAAIYFTDITEQKKLLQRITRDKQKLQDQNRRLSEIAWIQSHKVRGPLANILGLVPLLEINNTTDNENAIILEGIKSASENLDTVIREISGKTTSAATLEMYERQYKCPSVSIEEQ